MGDEKDGKSLLANLPALITALGTLAALVGGFWWWAFPPTPEVSFFSIDPVNITAGDTATLSWAVSNADSVYINHGVGTVNKSGNKQIEPDPTTTSYTITAKNKGKETIKTFNISVHFDKLNLSYSDYKTLIENEEYPFGASVAMNDSIEAAQKEIPTGIKVNASNNESVIEYANPNNISHEFVEVSRQQGVILTLTGDKKAFNITPLDPAKKNIFNNKPGNNYATWRWDVVPLIDGPHILTLTAGSDYGGTYSQLFPTKDIPIKVIVTRPVPSTTPNDIYIKGGSFYSNVTKIAHVAAEKPANATAPAPAATKTPGFEGIFAIVGMIAITHFILGRKH